MIAFSGVDGSGKSTQAAALRSTLERLGYDATVVWTPLASDWWLVSLSSWAKRVLRLLRSIRRRGGARGSGQAATPAIGLRGRSPIVNHMWATLVAVGNGLSHRRSIARHASRGRVVIFDRYVLDSVARLHFFYGEDASFRVQHALIAVLSPRPTLSFFLDLPAEASAVRKSDDWSYEELSTQVLLYRREHASSGALRLDAGRDREDLCAQIAREAWRILG